MKRKPLLLLCAAAIFMILILTGFDPVPINEPTQTPYVIYVVVTATPEPAADPVIERPSAAVPVIERPSDAAADTGVSLVNDSSTSAESSLLSLVNENTSEYEDEIIRRVVATMYAQSNAALPAAAATAVPVANGDQAIVRQSDGSTCTLSLEVLSEPTWQAGCAVPKNEVFWKEWVVRNTGTCTWTPDYYFVFDSGWQIGSTRFTMKKTTAPGETLTVRLGMTAQLESNRNYYSTYILEAPDGTRAGKITSSFTVRDAAYFAPTATPAPRPKPPSKPGPQNQPWGPPSCSWWWGPCW